MLDTPVDELLPRIETALDEPAGDERIEHDDRPGVRVAGLQ